MKRNFIYFSLIKCVRESSRNQVINIINYIIQTLSMQSNAINYTKTVLNVPIKIKSISQTD